MSVARVGAHELRDVLRRVRPFVLADRGGVEADLVALTGVLLFADEGKLYAQAGDKHHFVIRQIPGVNEVEEGFVPAVVGVKEVDELIRSLRLADKESVVSVSHLLQLDTGVLTIQGGGMEEVVPTMDIPPLFLSRLVPNLQGSGVPADYRNIFVVDPRILKDVVPTGVRSEGMFLSYLPRHHQVAFAADEYEVGVVMLRYDASFEPLPAWNWDRAV